MSVVKRLNSFFDRYALPVLVGITLSLLSGSVSLLKKFVDLQLDVTLLKIDIESIKDDSLPEIKEELQRLHNSIHHVYFDKKKTYLPTASQSNSLICKTKLVGSFFRFNRKKYAESQRNAKITFSNYLPLAPTVALNHHFSSQIIQKEVHND